MAITAEMVKELKEMAKAGEIQLSLKDSRELDRIMANTRFNDERKETLVSRIYGRCVDPDLRAYKANEEAQRKLSRYAQTVDTWFDVDCGGDIFAAIALMPTAEEREADAAELETYKAEMAPSVARWTAIRDENADGHDRWIAFTGGKTSR